MILGDGTHDFNVGDRVRVLWCYGEYPQNEHVGATGTIIGFGSGFSIGGRGRPGRHIVGAPNDGVVFSEGAYVRFDDETIEPHPQCLTDDIEPAPLVSNWDELLQQLESLNMQLRNVLTLGVSDGTRTASQPLYAALVKAENGLDSAIEEIREYVARVPAEQRAKLV